MSGCSFVWAFAADNNIPRDTMNRIRILMLVYIPSRKWRRRPGTASPFDAVSGRFADNYQVGFTSYRVYLSSIVQISDRQK